VKPADRYAWIEDRLRTVPGNSTNILDAPFVDAYIEATGAAWTPCNWSAHRCPQFNLDLAAMFKAGTLRRARTTLGFNWQPGWPTWVYTYELRFVPGAAKRSAVDDTVAQYYASLNNGDQT
jgi:hypothetical protein